MFSLHLRSVVHFENWREVAVAVLLNMLRRLQRDVGLTPTFTRMCRRCRHLLSWCLRSLLAYQDEPLATSDDGDSNMEDAEDANEDGLTSAMLLRRFEITDPVSTW